MDRLDLATALLRGGHLAAAMSLFGCLAFGRFVVPEDAAGLPRRELNRIAWISGWLAVGFGVPWLAAVTVSISGADTVAALLNAVPVVALRTDFGQFACLRLVLLTGALTLLAIPGRRARLAALLIAGGALALQPLLGHAGASDSRATLIPIEIAHLLAAGAWLGGLLPLLICVVRAPAPLAATLCERFTPLGLMAVGTIALSALPQAGAFIGGIGGLLGTHYGRLALVKLGLFLLAIGLALANRLLFTTRLGTNVARGPLIASIAVEAVAVVCVVFAAALMASSVPAAHEQPVWPFAWRPSTEAWEDPETRGRLVRLLIALGFGAALVGTSLAFRRFRVLAVTGAAIAIAPFAPALGLLLEEAYPTSYAQSTTGFTVAAIARGADLFTQFCAACHKAQEGSGGDADLSAPHIWGHRDGDLFWRVANGAQDAGGSALMPGFGAALSADDIWALIDFIHARNIGRQVQTSGRWSPPAAAPGTPLRCAGRDADTLADLAGAVVVVDVEDATTEPHAAAVPGTVTIRLRRDAEGTPGNGECVAASADAWQAWRVLAGASAERFAAYRAVVDGLGWLRAWVPPGAAAEAVTAAVRDARDHPIAAAPALSGHHHH